MVGTDERFELEYRPIGNYLFIQALLLIVIKQAMEKFRSLS